MPDVLANTWRQLVRRRLWPVALLLLAALAAVPFVVGREAEPVALPPDPVPSETVEADDSVGEPIVAMAAAGDRDRRRRVLGARKDPFAPAPQVIAAARKAAADAEQKQQASQPAAGEKAAAGSGGATAEAAPADDAEVPTVAPGAGGTPVASPAPAPVVEPAPKKRTYPNNSLIVRFGGAAGGELERAVLEPLEALPAGDAADTEAGPLLIYVGLSKDRKTAKFMVDESAEPFGDGRCEPQPGCETLLLRKGDTEFFDVKDETGTVVAQYQLDLVGINAKRKPAAKQARRSVAKVATADDRTLVAGVAAP